MMKDKKDKVSKKMGRPPPDWLKNLSPGEYTAKELEEISGKLNQTVRKLMIFHGASAEYKFNGSGVAAIYKWQGLKNE